MRAPNCARQQAGWFSGPGADRSCERCSSSHVSSQSENEFTSSPVAIDWIEAADYYACLYVAGKTHLVRRSMSELERDLDPAAFCRIHQPAIVNLDRVRAMQLNAGGEYEVALAYGTKLRLSRSYRDRLQSRLRSRA